MAKLLVIDDDEELLQSVAYSLSLEHYQVETAEDGESGLYMLNMNAYDLAIVDFDLPHITGPELCKKYRLGGGKAPVLMLTANSTIDGKVTGFDAGADDYLTKPFLITELYLRVKALLRRVGGDLAADNLVFGDITLEPSNFRASKNGKEVRLIRKEFAILELLVRYPGRIFSLDDIINRVWNLDALPTYDVVRSHMSSLRRKLADNQVIETVYGLGYRANLPAEDNSGS
jgi:DNA-binding response OmpR family regulator